MPEMTVRVTQRYRTIRVIDLHLDAPDTESAVESVSSGAVDLPEWSDERWKEGWELVDEDVTPVVEKQHGERRELPCHIKEG
jgi:hypothetical protein